MDHQGKFTQYLRANGIRRSEQRQVILDAFLKTEKHVTMTDLYDLARRRDRSIGYATVYRAMKVVCASGLAREVDFGDGIMRFEHHFNHEHHDHLICVKCGKVIEAVDPQIERLQKKLARKHGITMLNHRLQIFGVCPVCKGKDK